MYLSHLIYYSKIALNHGHRGAFKEIKGILQKAAEYNVEHGITGGLLFNQVYFAQIIEGDRKVITETFCRIAKDPRHEELVLLEVRPIMKRRFDSWNMGFAGKSDVAQKLYVKYGASEEFNPAKMTADSLRGFLEEVIDKDDVLNQVLKKKMSAK